MTGGEVEASSIGDQAQRFHDAADGGDVRRFVSRFENGAGDVERRGDDGNVAVVEVCRAFVRGAGRERIVELDVRINVRDAPAARAQRDADRATDQSQSGNRDARHHDSRYCSSGLPTTCSKRCAYD